jgi:hypothetical protein
MTSQTFQEFQVFMIEPMTGMVMTTSQIFKEVTSLDNFLRKMIPISHIFRFQVSYRRCNYNQYSYSNTGGQYIVNFNNYMTSEEPVNLPVIPNDLEEYHRSTPPSDDPEWHYLDSQIRNTVNGEYEEESEETNTSLESEAEDMYLYEGFTLKKYGKGYLLKSPDDHPDVGIKYYPSKEDCKAWWLRCDTGWFVKRENKNYFLERGAEFVFQNRNH